MNSSVVELIELINGHIPDILFMEASNLSQIYLYHSNGLRFSFAVPMPILLLLR